VQEVERVHEVVRVSLEQMAVAVATRSKRDADGEFVERAEIALDELSLCSQGQHAGAMVLAIRSELGTPRLDRLRQRRLLLGPPR
jgi:hypothetical protein